ncbi:succinyl-CoA synthetase (ADP-forming) beta subunit [Archaeoglobus sulfaticallidus PM70-1]|uniref:Succinate--CoA ligase [ADP-forming] subunit beta n=1 Tax=Archaeoglobus sulfaticallidus PM70-1 TaxID=387631 RepID=N0BBC3_9EURY|nr:ADP-forming succinate--CoA ligase subunit beta [Archaeoglobus sulfaticallidus]AGK60308.1 succinyl-CoA synthetase (ADP-forming) beta subunit [Archaeoglobus sulfaticallidus PM70-1]
MKLHEYQAKEIFKEHGIPVPEGYVVRSVDEAVEAVKKLGKAVIKAQVLVGGRGKAGGVKVVDDAESAREVASQMLGSMIKGHKVEALLVEKAIDVEKELYLAYIVDKTERKPTIIFSKIGGINIEELAREHPESIFKVSYDPLIGLQDYHIRKLLFKAGVEDFKEFFSLIKKINEIAWKYEAELVEINPIVKTKEGLYAVDAVIIADDNALFRHPELESLRDSTEVDELEREARLKGLSYVRLDGDIGVIANGAGLAMTTMDMIAYMGGKPANFLDTGGGLADPEKMKNCLLHVVKDEKVKVVYINIFAEITRCEKVAEGIVKALDEMDRKVVLVVKLVGVNEDIGREILKKYMEEKGAEIYFVNTLEEGARKAVEITRRE